MSTWDDVLDGLERELDAVAQGAVPPTDAATTAWEPPADLGPLPAALADRARMLLARQHAQAARLRATLDETLAARRRTGREHEAARRLQAATATPTPPVYVDLVG